MTLHADQTVVTGQVGTRIVTEDVVGLPGGLPGLAGPSAPMKPGTGLIFGQTVDAGSSRPVAGALVTLSVTGVIPLRVMSDGQGRYAFRDLPAGNFNLTAAKGGYADGAFGRLRPQGQSQPVELADGGRVATANVSLWKFAAVTGQLVDESGEPMIGVAVRVLRKTLASGKPRLTIGASDSTDDRGLYRISMLEPGEYIVCVPMNQQNALRTAFEEIGRTGRGGVDMIAAAMPTGAAGGNFSFTLDEQPISTAGNAPDGRALAYPTLFYPAAVSASRATIITLGSGEERAGLDFRLPALPTARVSGTVISPSGPSSNLTLTLVPAESDDLVSPIETATTMSNASGAFTFQSVVPGNYFLRAVRSPRFSGAGQSETFTMASRGEQVTMTMVTRTVTGSGPAPALPTEPTLWAEQPVSVTAEDITDVTVALRTGLKVSGQLEWNGGAERPAMDQLPAIGIALEPADARTAAGSAAVRGRVETSGTFSTIGAVPGRYFVRASGAPQGWFFRGATLNGRDVSDLPLDLESGDVSGVILSFSDKQTELTGTVTTPDGPVDATAAVIVFPAERQTWTGYGASPRRLRNVRADAKGSYTVRGLPPGRYYLAATRESGAAEWQDPKFLEALANGATLITLTDGQKASQPLKVVR